MSLAHLLPREAADGDGPTNVSMGPFQGCHESTSRTSALFKRNLGRIPELQIVGADDASDLVLSASDAGEHGFDLTPRERDVIALLA